MLEIADEVVVVSYHKNCGALFIDLGELCHDVVGKVGVNVSGRLICNYKAGTVNEGAGKTDTLLLATRKLVGHRTSLVSEAYHTEHGRDLLTDGSAVGPRYVHCESNVIENRHIGNEAEVLKNDSHSSAKVWYLTVFDLHKIVTVDEEASGIGLLFPNDELHKGGFTCTRSTYDKNKFTGVYADINVVKGVCSRFVGFGNTFKLYNGLLTQTDLGGVNFWSSFLINRRIILNI